MKKMKARIKQLIIRMSKVRYFKRWVIFLMDVCLSTISSVLVILTIENLFRYSFKMELWIYGCVLLVSILSIFAFKSYANVIRHSTLREVWRLLFVTIFKDILLSICLWVGDIMPYFKTIFILGDFLLTFVALLCFRIFLLNVYNVILMSSYSKKKKVLIYGIGEDSISLAQGSKKIYMSDYVIDGFLVHGHKERKLRIATYLE